MLQVYKTVDWQKNDIVVLVLIVGVEGVSIIGPWSRHIRRLIGEKIDIVVLVLIFGVEGVSIKNN